MMGGSDVDLATKQRAKTMQMASSPGVQRESGQWHLPVASLEVEIIGDFDPFCDNHEIGRRSVLRTVSPLSHCSAGAVRELLPA